MVEVLQSFTSHKTHNSSSFRFTPNSYCFILFIFTGNHYEKETVWLSQVITQEGTKLWRSNLKPVDYNEYRVGHWFFFLGIIYRDSDILHDLQAEVYIRVELFVV